MQNIKPLYDLKTKKTRTRELLLEEYLSLYVQKYRFSLYLEGTEEARLNQHALINLMAYL